MSLIKFCPDYLFTGNSTLTQTVLMVNEDGSIADLVQQADAGDEVQYLNGWICPGFINVHTHLELSHLKNRITPNKGMTAFLLEVMEQRHADASLMQHYMQTAEEQMLGNGIVAVGDICNTANGLAVKKSSSLYWHHFVEATGFVPATAKTRFDQAIAVAEIYRSQFAPDQISIVPHAPYSVSPKLFELIQNHNQSVVCMHSQESNDEAEFLTTGIGPLTALYERLGVQTQHFAPAGNSSLEYCLHYLPMAKRIVLVHNCTTTSADISLLRNAYEMILSHFYFCLCPNANQYIGNPLPNYQMLLDEGLQLCLGTDSLASNSQLSILSEMQTLQAADAQLPTETLLQWATLNGAKALGIDDRFGSFDKGKTPGILWLEKLGENQTLASATVQRLV